jgi:hypothetical protein
MHETGLVERRELMLEEPQGDVLALGDLSRRHRPFALTASQLHHGPEAVFTAEREAKHGALPAIYLRKW